LAGVLRYAKKSVAEQPITLYVSCSTDSKATTCCNRDRERVQLVISSIKRRRKVMRKVLVIRQHLSRREQNFKRIPQVKVQQQAHLLMSVVHLAALPSNASRQWPAAACAAISTPRHADTRTRGQIRPVSSSNSSKQQPQATTDCKVAEGQQERKFRTPSPTKRRTTNDERRNDERRTTNDDAKRMNGQRFADSATAVRVSINGSLNSTLVPC